MKSQFFGRLQVGLSNLSQKMSLGAFLASVWKVSSGANTLFSAGYGFLSFNPEVPYHKPRTWRATTLLGDDWVEIKISESIECKSLESDIKACLT